MEEFLFIGFIYKISKKGNDGIYIGSSKDINLRYNTHKRNCNIEKEKAHNFKVYRHIRDNGGWDSWTFEIVKIEYNLSVERLGDLEREYQIKEGHNLGTKRRDNGAKIVCACGGKYYAKGKWGHEQIKKHKNYFANLGTSELERWEAEIEKKKKENTEKAKKRAEKKAEKAKERIECVCGGHYIAYQKQRHCRTTKHLDYVDYVESKK